MRYRMKSDPWAMKLLAILLVTSFAVTVIAPANAQIGTPTPRPDARRIPPRRPLPLPSPSPERRAPAPGLHGFADLHAHLMAHEGFGGTLFFGRPEGALTRALPWCDSAHGARGLRINPEYGFPELGHRVGGYPEFDGWPRFTTTVHQQAHVDWIKRAFEGGLRLVSMLAVNAEILATAFPGGRYPTDDRSAIDRQIAAMREMASRHSDWMEIALSPSDARRIIGQNKLAVVLGIEVDSLGNWKRPENLPSDPAEARRVIRAELERLHSMGVRQIGPIHLADNALGGSAIYNHLFDANNLFLTGEHFTVEEGWNSGIRFRLGLDVIGLDSLGDISRLIRRNRLTESPQWRGMRSHRNAKGLTPQGVIFLEEMMRLRMILDLDHMSEKAIEEALTMMEAAGYPVICSHTGFRDLAYTADVPFSARTHRDYGTSDIHKVPHEADKSAVVIERVRRLGGIVAPILNQRDVRQWGRRVPNDSAGSSKSWAQAYLYAVEKMRGQGVGLGSDVNGLAQLPGPRFGTYAAHGLHEDAIRQALRLRQANAQTNGVRYESPIRDYRRYRFEGPGNIYGDEKTLIWEAIAIYKSRTDPDRADVPLGGGKIRNLAKGFWAAERRRELEAKRGTDSYAEQRAAFLVASNLTPSFDGRTDPVETVRLYPLVKEVWEVWKRMEGTEGSPSLIRSIAGRRDFDINLDGFAHYGMLPDFIQDLRNIGLTDRDLEPLFRSAEHYIQMWERAERAVPPVTTRAVTVTIHQVRQIDNLDSETVFGRDRADFYAQVTIAGHRQTSAVVNERDNPSPGWSFSRPTNESVVNITISLFDEDGGLSGPDDHCDINPFGGRRDLNITYDLLPGRISGNASGVRGSRIHVIGAGDRNRAEIWFSVNHR